MATTEIRDLGRAKNAALELLEKRLFIPKIYIDATWSNQSVDVLGIDRDGAGDVHVVLLVSCPTLSIGRGAEALEEVLNPTLDRITSIPAQYKYIGIVNDAERSGVLIPGIPHTTLDRSFAPDGIGKVGYISIELPYGREPRAEILMKPERFRARVADLADTYVASHSADWELRA
jgi:hypothetical protein